MYKVKKYGSNPFNFQANLSSLFARSLFHTEALLIPPARIFTITRGI